MQNWNSNIMSKNSKLQLHDYKESYNGEHGVLAYSRITNGRLQGKNVCIIDYNPSHYISLDVEMLNYNRLLPLHYERALAVIFKGEPALYKHSMRLYRKLKKYDLKLKLSDRKRTDGGLCDYGYLMCLYFERHGLEYSCGGITNICALDNSIAK